MAQANREVHGLHSQALYNTPTKGAARACAAVRSREAMGEVAHNDISHLACIPVAEVLVEFFSGVKHAAHISHLACIPVTDVLVEGRRISKHLLRE